MVQALSVDLQSIAKASYGSVLKAHCISGAAFASNSSFDLAIGEDLKAQAEASDKKTDNLPSLKDVGKSLGGQFGQNDPKDVGKAIDKNTPGKLIFLIIVAKQRSPCGSQHSGPQKDLHSPKENWDAVIALPCENT